MDTNYSQLSEQQNEEQFYLQYRLHFLTFCWCVSFVMSPPPLQKKDKKR